MAESSAERIEKKQKAVIVRGVKLGKGRPKVCVPLTGRSREEIRAELLKMKTGSFDLIEWRADKFERISDPAALRETAEEIRQAFPEKPVIFTIRTNRDMEDFEISDEAYKQTNLFAAEQHLGDLIDLEYSRGSRLVSELAEAVKKTGVSVICSMHKKNCTPPAEEILRTMTEMEATGADLVKYAAMPGCERDVLELMDATLSYAERGSYAPCITMSMGRKGMISRLSGALTGSCLTFGTIGAASAPGQLPCSVLNEVLELL